MKTNVVYVEPQAVEERLAQMELAEEVLVEALRLAHVHAARLTGNHPRIYPGIVMWAEVVASLRNLLRPMGWHRSDSSVYELVINGCETLGIAVASGDEGTGIEAGHPSNKSPKGRYTVKAVDANRQADMFAEMLPPQSAPSVLDTWVLLHHFDPKRKERRIELSRPLDMDSDGKIIEWSERIILTPLSFDDDFDDIVLPETPDIDFEVHRKVE
ncbi:MULTISPECIES: hypothetical protein [unclassified Rhodanobacter]|uniref:Uncharacterized protein n=1 Tax=Rhodanobacter humi TaxID=1888173 RepID=A0ABV4APF9_9GAMM